MSTLLRHIVESSIETEHGVIKQPIRRRGNPERVKQCTTESCEVEESAHVFDTQRGMGEEASHGVEGVMVIEVLESDPENRGSTLAEVGGLVLALEK